MIENILERVARAICLVDAREMYEGRDAPARSYCEIRWDKYEDDAWAALAAVRNHLAERDIAPEVVKLIDAALEDSHAE